MKVLTTMAVAFSMMFMTSCASTKTDQTATVTRDCTGTYLRVSGKDYLVCNTDILKNYKEGQQVIATFSKVKDCPEFDGTMVCMMYHENEGTIRIKSVK